MRTLIQPFKINQVNTVLIRGEQFAFHMSELPLTFMGFNQLTLWWCFWFTVGYVIGRVKWVAHHFHYLHSNLMWKVAYPFSEFNIIPGSGNPRSQSFLVPLQGNPNITFTSTSHLFHFHEMGCGNKAYGRKSGMTWKMAIEIFLHKSHTKESAYLLRGEKVRIRLCFSITHT